MCLDLKPKAKLQIAEEDIVCYKYVRKIKISTAFAFDFAKYNGAEFTGVINGIECNGMIVRDCGNTFFCTNDPELDGIKTNKRGNYAYSWMYDNNVTKIVVNGNEITCQETMLKTPFQGIRIEIGNTYVSELDKYANSVNKGLHSFKLREDCVNNKENSFVSACSSIIVECVIPKGSKYYVGEWNGTVSYASDTLTYNKIINPPYSE